jgi:2-phosphosulfolactate phosphatase
MKLDVVMAPVLLPNGDEQQGCVCAVVDVLRATSTIITALASGAAAVYPCLSVDEARSRAGAIPGDRRLLGGEERGKSIPGFDLGNSPLEYLVPGTVVGKEIFFYTTNGTGAIRRAHSACGGPIYIAALINASAAASKIVAATLAVQAAGIAIVCSGSYGKPSAEDVFCAGLIIDHLGGMLGGNGVSTELTDAAGIAAGFAAGNRQHPSDVLGSSEHGSYLRTIGFEEDIEFASRLDTYDVVPVFDGDRISCG